MQRLALFCSTAAYSGFVPVAPGTAGSLVAALLLFLFSSFHSAPFWIATIAVIIIGVWASAEGERYFGCEDPGQVVIDEVAGMFVSVAFLPVTWEVILLAFVLFRVFDIWKPFPVRQAESLGHALVKEQFGKNTFQVAGGIGIMADDIVAGIYANIGLHVIWYYVL